MADEIGLPAVHGTTLGKQLASEVESDLRAVRQLPQDEALRRRLAAQGLALLPALEEHLTSDLPIAALEGYEAVLKAVLRQEMARQVSGPAARAIAEMQRRVGPLLKYKSYAVKASSPLGYSIFLQEPGQGFSFQRHLTHKTEVFHILDAQAGGFVFLCSHEEWAQCYERARFAAWLAGERDDPDYERFRIPARLGDVFVLDQLGIVHTVVGCVLEEFATVSTDMVDRLHAQNEGRAIPPSFTQAAVRARLRGLRTPPESRLVRPGAGGAGNPDNDPRREVLPAERVHGGRRTVLIDGFVAAALHEVDPGAESEMGDDAGRATSLYVRQGGGSIRIGTAAEVAAGEAPPMRLAAGDLLTIPPGIRWVVANEGGSPLELVEHRIRPEVALI
jgi:mannose-6-phosphate isomerase-like protein (cupin superfamily)